MREVAIVLCGILFFGGMKVVTEFQDLGAQVIT